MRSECILEDTPTVPTEPNLSRTFTRTTCIDADGWTTPGPEPTSRSYRKPETGIAML